MKALVINAGSSSVKYYLYDMPRAEILARGSIERIGEKNSELTHFFGDKTYAQQSPVKNVEDAMELMLETLVRDDVGVIKCLSEIGDVGHRVVHGDEEFTGSVVVDEAVITSIEKFADLAPRHNPPNLAGIRAIQRRAPASTLRYSSILGKKATT